jgi:hypothetical protein
VLKSRLRTQTTLVRVNFTHKSDFYTHSVVLTRMSVIITLMRDNIALCVYKLHSCGFKAHFAFKNYTRACEHHTMRVNITLYV